MFKWSLLIVALIFSFGCTKSQNLDTKVLTVVSDQKVKGMDPINAGDKYSINEVARVYEGLLQFHYLKRPYTLQPALAESLPKVSDDGLTYTVKLKKGILFHDNKCFKDGKGRELVAEDVVYSIKRLADAHNHSIGWWILDGRLKGLNEWRKKYEDKDASDYSEVVEGLKAIDKYTVQFVLSKPFPQFQYSLAMPYTFIVAKEAVEHYKKDFLNNPVGTGPYVTGTYTQSNQIIYTKNPKFRDEFYPSEGAAGDKEAGLLDSAGKKLPFAEKIVVRIITETQPAWLSFEKGKTDYYKIPKDNFETVVTPSKELTDAYVKKGIKLRITPDLDITYMAFNNDDKLFQGEKGTKLKQAMSLAYNVDESNKLFYGGYAIPAQTIVPPGIAGYDKDYKNPYAGFDIEKAKKLLAEAGYPGGKGLPVIQYETVADSTARQMGDFLSKKMAAIGVKIQVNPNTWPELVKKTHARQAQMFGMAWGADYPDAENFLQLLYGPNASPGPNGSNYNDPKFNKMYEKAVVMQDSPERTKLYEEMAQYLVEKMPMILGVHRTSFTVKHGWLKNYKFSTFEYGNEKYMDVDLAKKAKLAPKL